MASNLEKALNEFGSKWVKDSRSNLAKKNKNASSKLSKSLRYDVDVFPNSFTLELGMEDYGDFVDKGVKGVGGTKSDGTRWKRKRVTNGRYKYTNKKPPASVFSNWSIRRGLAPRSKTGQFTSRKGLQFAIANTVYHEGLETTNFYSKPFETAFKLLPQDVVEAYALDMEQFLEQTIQ